MNDWKLPDDLQQLEDELMALPRPVLPASLRTGMDHDVSTRLRGERRRRWYGYVAAAAAAALLWANLSLRAATATNLRLAAQPQPSSVTELESQLRELLPELDARETRRQVVMIQASSRLGPRLADSVSAPRSHRFTDLDPLL
jgi:hypothetical protein